MHICFLYIYKLLLLKGLRQEKHIHLSYVCEKIVFINEIFIFISKVSLFLKLKIIQHFINYKHIIPSLSNQYPIY